MRRVGWIRIGALGDLLAGLASLRETLDKWPEAKVTVIGSRLWLDILEPLCWSQIDRIVVVESAWSHAVTYEVAEEFSGLAWKRARARELTDEFSDGYDVIFDSCLKSVHPSFLAFLARVPERWGAASGLRSFIFNRRGTYVGDNALIHLRDVSLLLMDEAEAKQRGEKIYDGKTLAERIELSPRIRKWRTAGLPTPRRIDTESVRPKIRSDRYFVINPTTGRKQGAWPTARFRDFLRAIEQRELFTGLLPVVVGAPDETAWLKDVAGHQFRCVQPATMGELFNVIAGAEFLLTNASAVQFVAAAVGTKTLSLLGRAAPEVCGPLGPSDMLIQGDGANDFKAYESISVESVITSLQKLLVSG